MAASLHQDHSAANNGPGGRCAAGKYVCVRMRVTMDEEFEQLTVPPDFAVLRPSSRAGARTPLLIGPG